MVEIIEKFKLVDGDVFDLDGNFIDKRENLNLNIEVETVHDYETDEIISQKQTFYVTKKV